MCHSPVSDHGPIPDRTGSTVCSTSASGARHVHDRRATHYEGMTVDRQSRSGARPELALVDFGDSALFADDEEESWQERALCAQTDPEAFFPEKGGSTREAKKICTGCEVKAECLEYALANDERFGIWGGLSERERRRIKREATG